jgi:hypothetical protein
MGVTENGGGRRGVAKLDSSAAALKNSLARTHAFFLNDHMQIDHM